MLHIVADGSADMPENWENEYGIHILPLHIRFGEEEYLQGRDVNQKNFYDLVRLKRIVPKTSLPSPYAIMDFYRSIAQKGDNILSVHVTSKMSGTFSAVQTAARDLKNEFKIYPFDSGAGSAAIGFMCREARLLYQQGFNVDKIVDQLAKMRDRLTVIFTLENLEFARLSGRINMLQGAISSMLKINPVIVLRDGLLSMADRVRTRQKAIDHIVEQVRLQVGNTKVKLAIVHAAAPEMAQAVVEKVRSLIPHTEIIVTELAVPIAAHLGPGTIGIVACPEVEEK